MYNRPIPIVALSLEQFKKLESGASITVCKGGTLRLNPGSRPAPAALLG
jgi:hypothetical protein